MKKTPTFLIKIYIVHKYIFTQIDINIRLGVISNEGVVIKKAT